MAIMEFIEAKSEVKGRSLMLKIPLLERSLRMTASLVAFPLSLGQMLISSMEETHNKPTGWLAHIGLRKLHVSVTGQGSPTIILESGMGGCSLDWSLVIPSLSEDATVIAYDRAGFGWSTQGMERPTCGDYVDNLRKLLSTIGAAPPYVLVGHSYGGMIMRLFASRYPGEVSGLVLVDSTHESRYLPEQTTIERNKQRLAYHNQLKLGYMLSPLGLPRLLKKHIGSKRLPEPWNKSVRTLGYRVNAYKAAYSELLCTEESALQLKNAEPLRRDLPVIVLSAGEQDAAWQRDQRKLSNLTNNTKHIIVKDSWHSIQIHKPEAVISAIKGLLH
ncbi:alpha/beta fold hydrolase [Paenibacillus castaneae]|uniref:alpha/beta fold hydrolase n=2 Tax=Paenibacillus castaneae TaxID=474957 RepID=UPI001FBB0C20|nr:alpha/beta hydrolase [Paenibacillus castaneae]